VLIALSDVEEDALVSLIVAAGPDGSLIGVVDELVDMPFAAWAYENGTAGEGEESPKDFRVVEAMAMSRQKTGLRLLRRSPQEEAQDRQGKDVRETSGMMSMNLNVRRGAACALSAPHPTPSRSRHSCRICSPRKQVSLSEFVCH